MHLACCTQKAARDTWSIRIHAMAETTAPTECSMTKKQIRKRRNKYIITVRPRETLGVRAIVARRQTNNVRARQHPPEGHTDSCAALDHIGVTAVAFNDIEGASRYPMSP